MLGDGHCDAVCNTSECSWDLFDCGCAPGCNWPDLGHCKAECLVPECAYDSMQDSIESLTCDSADCPWDEFSPSCSASLMCGENSVDVLMFCCDDCCAAGFFPHPNNPVVCIRSPDQSYASSPKLLYVDSNFTDSAGDGSESRPFQSLRAAFLRLYERYTTILLFPGPHNFDPSGAVVISYGRFEEEPVAYPHLAKLTITSLSCFRHEQVCERAVILSNNDQMPGLYLAGVKFFEMKDVSIESQLPLDFCLSFLRCGPTYPFIRMPEGGYIRLENVAFRHFRLAITAVISVDNATVELKNVEFLDIVMRFNSLLRGIVATETYVNVTYYGGSVDLLNNGYDYKPRYNFFGFLTAASADVDIRDVRFSYNLLETTNENKVEGTCSLIMIGACYQCRFQSCTFDYNVGYDGAVLRLMGKNINFWFNDLDSARRIRESFVEIENCVFRNNTGNRGTAVLIEFTEFLQAVRIVNCSFLYNLAEQYGIVVIEAAKAGLPGSFAFSKESPNEKGRRVSVTYPAATVLLSDLTFVNCTVPYGLIIARNIQTVVLVRVSITTGNIEGADRISTAFQAFSLFPDAHVPDSIPPSPTISCASVFNFTAVASLSMDRLAVSKPNCTQVLVSSGAVFSLSNSLLSAHTGNSSFGSALHVDAVQRTTLVNVSFTGNTNIHERGAGIAFIAGESVNIEESTFTENSATVGGALYFTVAEVAIASSVFERNVGDSGAAVYVSLSPHSQHSVAIHSTVFASNRAPAAGTVHCHIDQDFAYLSLSLKSTAFRNNTSAKGSAVFTSPGVQFTHPSSVTECILEANRADSGGTLHLEASAGNIDIESTEFGGNFGLKGTAVYRRCLLDSTVQPCELTFTNVLLQYNTGLGIIDISNSPAISISALSCLCNTGTCLTLDSSRLTVTASEFFNNTAVSGPVLFLLSSNATVHSSQFRRNAASATGGVAQVQKDSSFRCTNSTFFNNSALGEGGVLFLRQRSEIDFNGTLFVGNFARGNGFVLFLAMCELESRIAHSELRDNFGTGSGVIYALSAVVAIVNSTVLGNRGGTLTSGTIAQLSLLFISGCEFSNQSSASGTFLYLIHSAGAVLSSTFQSALATALGGAIAMQDTTLVVKQSLFKGLESELGGAVSLQNGSNLTVISCSFWHIATTTIHRGAIDAQKSLLTVDDSIFDQYLECAVSGKELQLTVNRSSFTGNCYSDAKAAAGAAIYCDSCVDVHINSSLFGNLTADSGSAVYITKGSAWTIESCIFRDNLAVQGGAVYAEKSSLAIVASAFTRNRAVGVAAKGGALALIGGVEDVNCVYTVSSNSFLENTAEYEGGALFWIGSQPTLAFNFYSGNRAKYGSDCASTAIQLSLANSSSTNLSNVASGQTVSDKLVLHLLDHYSNLLTIDNSSFAQITILDPNSLLNGVVRVQAVKGVYVFDSFAVIATPGSNATLAVTSSLLESSSAVYIPVSMRQCIVGETQNNDMCILCGPGTYSLSPTSSCKSCPSEAFCLGNFTMVPRSGYWRSRADTDRFFRCPNAAACLGSLPDSISLTGLCAEGYEGNKCESCAQDHYRTAKVYCAECDSVTTEVVTKCVVVCGICIVLALFASGVVASANGGDSLVVAHARVFVDYVQLTMQLDSLDLMWPSVMLQLFNAMEKVGGFPEVLFSTSCVVSGENESEAYRIKLLLLSLALPMLLSLLLFLWCASVLCSSRSNRSSFVCSAIVLFFLFHTSCLRVMLGVFHCEEIDSDQYWLVGLQVRCWTADHLKYALSLALPSVIIWAIAVPAGLFIYIRLQRKQMLTRSGKYKYWYLVNGFRANYYFWELTVVYRKVLMSALIVSMARVSQALQVVAVLAILVISLLAQVILEPFAFAPLNLLERRALLLALLMLYSGLIFSTNTFSSDFRLSLSIVLASLNAVFTIQCLKPILFTAVLSLIHLAQRSSHSPTIGRVQMMQYGAAQGQRNLHDSTPGETTNLHASHLPGSNVEISR